MEDSYYSAWHAASDSNGNRLAMIISIGWTAFDYAP